MPTRTPFGNPDGSRSDIQDVVENFVTFETLNRSTGLDIRPDDLSVRIIVGAKGSGKTVYLRRLRAAAIANDSVYADIVQQDLPATSNIVKFCQCFSRRDLTEKWMQLWYCAIMRSLATHLLHVKKLSSHLSTEQREELESFPPEFVPRSRRQVSVYSQVTDIINRFHTGHAFSRYFDDPAWAELSTAIGEIIVDAPPVYFFIDSVDEEYANAPMYWLQCQKGLFFRAMRFLREQHFGGRLHVIVCVRDHVLASVLRGEHQNRYRGEPHINTLGWEYSTAEFFLKEKIARLPRESLVRSPRGPEPTVADWLGTEFIENRVRGITEPILQYLLRHTRLLPRDIVILGNKLSELVVNARGSGHSEVSPDAIRRCVGDVARSFGKEQLAICANHIVSSGMPADAARNEYDFLYTGDSEYTRGFADHLESAIRNIGKDRFDQRELHKARAHAAELFGEASDPLSVLWQNRLLGYVEAGAENPREVFFSESNCDHFNLPLDKNEYLFHSSMIDAVGIEPVGCPVGQGAMDESRMVGGSPDPEPARVGSYPILGVIGRGGMGTVYLAEDRKLKRRVALKLLPAPEPGNDGPRRLHREARVLAAVHHPNIATVFSLEDDGGTHFLTMEFVPGDTLQQRIARRPLSVKEALTLGRQVALALDYAHRQGVIHRDLKPSNIMVTPEGHVKVLDFGIAKVLEPVASGSATTVSAGREDDLPSATGTIAGTVGYMSPEQLRGEPVSRRSDIWAFGCCLYECLTGRPAFPGKSKPERIAATMEREPDLAAVPQVDPKVKDLVRRSLDKDPERRPASIQEAIRALDGA